jgi:hypothetical protein
VIGQSRSFRTSTSHGLHSDVTVILATGESDPKHGSCAAVDTEKLLTLCLRFGYWDSGIVIDMAMWRGMLAHFSPVL